MPTITSEIPFMKLFLLVCHDAGQIKPCVNLFPNQVNLFQPRLICFNVDFFLCLQKKLQHTTQEKQNSPNLLASELKDPGSQDDLLVPLKNTNTGQPSAADLQVEPSVENPNKCKYVVHEFFRENQESYNKKM